MTISKLFRRVLRFVFRDAVTGKYVSKDYAEAHPNTTVRERLK